MEVAVADDPMPKKSDRKDVPVKMDCEVVRKAKIVAAFRGQSLAEFLSVTLGKIIDGLMDQEYAKEKAPKPTLKRKGRADQ